MTRWAAAIRALRTRRPTWGADKLLAVLGREHPRALLPSRSAVVRWLRREGLSARRKVRARRGPALRPREKVEAGGPNELWTVDFKGWFRTGDGRRCDPLTVRDLFSRFVLGVEAVGSYSESAVALRMRRLFRRYGLPRAIRVDNGAPFGSPGTGAALGLTRLSVGWMRLGITVEFTRPGCPQDNGAHEQMHRVLKAETTRPPEQTLTGQRRRLEAWRREYNEVRPHEALGQRCPAEAYQPSERKYRTPKALVYPKEWQTRRVSAQGTIKWQARVRNVGRAFTGERIALREKSLPEQTSQGAPRMIWEVYLGEQQLGEIHAADQGGMRSARWSKAESRPTQNKT